MQVVADELYFPNGMVITPDGGVLIVAETFAQRLTAFDIEPDGTLRNRREWASFGAVPDTDGVAAAAALARLAPDGICLDADGAIWVADALFHRVVRVQPGGRVVEQIGTGEQGVYGCMLGSTDGCTLYLCAAPSFAEHERSNTRDSQLLACQVDVAHAGLP